MAKDSLTQQTISGIFWQSSRAGANIVLRALILIMLARHLPAQDFGLVAAAMVVATVAQAFTQIGVTKALVQMLTLTEQHVRSAFALSVFMGSGAAVLLIFGAPAFAAPFHMIGLEPIIRVLSVLLLLNSIAAVPAALLDRARRFKISSMLELSAFVIAFGGIGLLLAIAGYGVWALVMAEVSQGLVRMLLYLVIERPPIGFWPNRSCLGDLLFIGSGFSAGQIGNLVATQIDYLIVGRLLGAEALGLYNRAYQFLMLPAQLVGTATQTVLFPSIASIQDQPERIARAFLRGVGVIAMATLPMSGVLIVLAPELVDVTLGERWHGMVLPFQLLASTLMFRTSYKVSDSVSLAMGSMYRRAWRQWVYAGAVVIGAVLGANWGLPGVAIGVGAAIVVNFLIMLQLALQITRVSASHVLAIHLRHLMAALPIVFTDVVVVAFLRAREAADVLVLLVGLFAAALTSALMWWKCRWAFGEDGKWLHAVADDRLAPLRARIRNSLRRKSTQN